MRRVGPPRASRVYGGVGRAGCAGTRDGELELLYVGGCPVGPPRPLNQRLEPRELLIRDRGDAEVLAGEWLLEPVRELRPEAARFQFDLAVEEPFDARSG